MFTRNYMICHIFVLLCILSTEYIANSQFSPNVTPLNPCSSKTTCRDCIQTKGCAWCMDPEYGSERPRCVDPSHFSFTQCRKEFIYNPDNEITIKMDHELTRSGQSIQGGVYSSGSSYSASSSGSSEISGSYSASGGSSMSGRQSSSGGSYGSRSSSMSGGSSSASGAAFGFGSQIVQIRPQIVDLKLRINQEYKLPLMYSQAQDYPVDLYYLMDLSKSMEDDKTKLSTLGNLLSDTMRNITSNFRLGFGSFVDKVLMPYVSTVPKKLEHPCDKCEAPYGYKNHMPLSTDTATFSEQVRSAAVSGNLDAPEGGFDAIMQAIVCRQKIGWREQARRMLVFSTDAGFHYAGDGKLGGVITPNDGHCHLNELGLYTHSTIQDYPSISQINQKVKENAINIIFAVTQSQKGVYDKLSRHIEGSSSATLSDDSSNVVDLVREEYEKITSNVEMKDTASSSIKVTYYSSCLKTGSPKVQTNTCKGLKLGDVVTFDAEIVVTSCPKDPKDWKQTFHIYPVGINETLQVNLEMLCSCDCERPEHPLYNEHASNCSGHGTYKCGICDCDPNHFGRSCECSVTEVHSESERDRGCRTGNSTEDCSGRGSCVCGVCECNSRPNPEEEISGKYCECDNFSCERSNGLLCSGPEHGKCSCGTCQCEPGWTGPACDCRASNDTCIAPNSVEICSGHGTCDCGVCQCEKVEEGRYSGRYCEKCPTCSGRCHELKHCVQCQMYKTGIFKDNEEECIRNCTDFSPIGVEVVEVDDKKDEQYCTFYDENDCKFAFVYSEVDGKLIVRAQEKLECPPIIWLLPIVLGVIAAIVLIGLAVLLLWKLLTTIHDRREFARFEKERMMAKWDTGENPIYKQATSTFKNPTYAGK